MAPHPEDKPRHRNRCLVVLGLILVLGHMTAQVALAQRDPTGAVYMVVRPGATTVRETFRLDFRPPFSVWPLPDLPAEIDASTLRIMDRRREIILRDIQPDGPVYEHHERPVRIEQRQEFVVNPRGATPLAPTVWQGRFEGRVTGGRTLDCVYRMTGLVWRAHYDVLVRGQLAEVTNPVSLDVKGWIEVENFSSRTYSNLNLAVIGGAHSDADDSLRAPGILDLDEDSALADRWRDHSPEPFVPYRYSVGTGLVLASGQSTLFSYVDSVRLLVVPRLVVRGGDIPTDTRLRGTEASLLITFPSEKDLPPGRAAIHLGQRSSLVQEAWFKHTPARSEILIDMGKVPGVYVRRIRRERTERVDGGYEQMFELRIENTLPHAVPVHIDEAPLPYQSWTLLRASQTFQVLDRRLLFSPTVPPKAEIAIQYTLRVL